MEVNVSYIGRADNYYQSYTPDDLALLSSGIVTNPFGDDRLDYVENFIYDLNDNLLASNYFVNSYKPGNIDPVTGYYSSIVLDPETDVRNQGYDRGSIKVRYNFFRRLFKSSINQPFWIKEISTNRTEIRICRQDLANIELQQAFLEYDLQASSRAYYPDFYLNLGSNRLLIAVNVLYALQNGEGSLLVKLYEPLPEDINVKSTLWAVDKIAQSVEYSVSIEVPAQNVTVQNPLRGPNFSVALNEKVNQTTPLYNYSTLFMKRSSFI